MVRFTNILELQVNNETLDTMVENKIFRIRISVVDHNKYVT